LTEEKEMKVQIDFEVCKGCGLCVAACPKKILQIGKKSNRHGYYAVECIDEEKCIACAACAYMCPDSALEVK
jgi:2-oxoglutarate ferredoxin oxidoreductase subunit delta